MTRGYLGSSRVFKASNTPKPSKCGIIRSKTKTSGHLPCLIASIPSLPSLATKQSSILLCFLSCSVTRSQKSLLSSTTPIVIFFIISSSTFTFTLLFFFFCLTHTFEFTVSGHILKLIVVYCQPIGESFLKQFVTDFGNKTRKTRYTLLF